MIKIDGSELPPGIATKANSLASRPDQADQALKADQVSLGETKTEATTYHPSEMNEVLEANYAALRDWVSRTLGEQGIATRVAVIEREIEITQLTPKEAQELVAEEGYFGVEQTSQRIVDFAIKVAGNDPSRLDAILEGVEDGFRQAEEAWGGELPEISYQTLASVHEKLAAWQEGAETTT